MPTLEDIRVGLFYGLLVSVFVLAWDSWDGFRKK